jgi:hypothetical protein
MDRDLAQVRPGDLVFVDTRALFMAPAKWREVTFVRWRNVWGGEYLQGGQNTAIVETDLRAPMLIPCGEDLTVASQYMRRKKS